MVRKEPPDSREVRRYARTINGFTLLEVLVAILVLTLMVTTAYGTIRVGNLAWRNGITIITRTDELRSLSALLRRQVSQTLPLRWQSEGKTQIAFEADQTRIRFIAPAPHYATEIGLFEYVIKIEREGLTTRLVLYYGMFHPAETSFSVSDSSEHVTLTDRFSKISFSYFGTRNEGESGDWYNRWESSNQFYPDLIHLNLAGGDKTAKWPDLYLPIHADY